MPSRFAENQGLAPQWPQHPVPPIDIRPSPVRPVNMSVLGLDLRSVYQFIMFR